MLERLEIGEDDLPPAIDRWKELLTDKDPSIRLAAEKFVFVALHGIPRPVAIPQPTNGPIVIKWEGDLADSGREEFVGRLRLPIE